MKTIHIVSVFVLAAISANLMQAQDDKKKPKPQDVRVINKPVEAVPTRAQGTTKIEGQVEVTKAPKFQVEVTNLPASQKVEVTNLPPSHAGYPTGWTYTIVSQPGSVDPKQMIDKMSSEGWELVPMNIPVPQANYTGWLWRKPR